MNFLISTVKTPLELPTCNTVFVFELPLYIFSHVTNMFVTPDGILVKSISLSPLAV